MKLKTVRFFIYNGTIWYYCLDIETLWNGLETRGRVQNIDHQNQNPDGTGWRKFVFADGFQPTSFDDETDVEILDEL